MYTERCGLPSRVGGRQHFTTLFVCAHVQLSRTDRKQAEHSCACACVLCACVYVLCRYLSEMVGGQIKVAKVYVASPSEFQSLRAFSCRLFMAPSYHIASYYQMLNHTKPYHLISCHIIHTRYIPHHTVRCTNHTAPHTTMCYDLGQASLKTKALPVTAQFITITTYNL